MCVCVCVCVCVYSGAHNERKCIHRMMEDQNFWNIGLAGTKIALRFRICLFVSVFICSMEWNYDIVMIS